MAENQEKTSRKKIQGKDNSTFEVKKEDELHIVDAPCLPDSPPDLMDASFLSDSSVDLPIAEDLLPDSPSLFLASENEFAVVSREKIKEE